jgi:anti-anti-sigma regulatory factor
MRAMQDVQKYGGKLRLSGMNDYVRPIFETARLDQIFLIDPQPDELLAD